MGVFAYNRSATFWSKIWNWRNKVRTGSCKDVCVCLTLSENFKLNGGRRKRERESTSWENIYYVGLLVKKYKKWNFRKNEQKSRSVHERTHGQFVGRLGIHSGCGYGMCRNCSLFFCLFRIATFTFVFSDCGLWYFDIDYIVAWLARRGFTGLL